MASLKKIVKTRNFWSILLIVVCLGLVIFGGAYYINSLRQDLSAQAASTVLTVTEQQQQAFDTFISGDRERMHSVARYFSQTFADDVEGIQDKLSAFSMVDAFYSVVNLDTGEYYSNRDRELRYMQGEELESYRALSGAGVRNAFPWLYADEPAFGYYECFTFADGTPGLYQKSYRCSQVSEEFSLSFYNGEGLGFIVTGEGEILLRSVDKSGNYSINNILELVPHDSMDADKELSAFTHAVESRSSGYTILSGDNGDFIYSYVPIESVDDWYLVSVVPVSAVTHETDAILMNSQATFIILFVLLAVFLTFFLLIWRSRKDLEERDQVIEYRERQFDIFATYLSNNTDDIYMMLNADGSEVEFVSPNVERVLGVTEEEVLADVHSFGVAKYVGGANQVTHGALAGMQPGDSLGPLLTERINLQTAEHKWFRETVYCVSMQKHNKIIVYISDRTRERKVQDTLSQALDMAQVANKAKSAFLGSVSHDIRTPMNAIIGLTMLLRDEAEDPEQVREYTQRIEAASQHLLGLINDVLDLNKIEGGGATLNITEINMPDIIDELNIIIRPQTRTNKQTFKIFASSFTYEHLLGDKLRINQILINILSNAVKYTQKGGAIELHVNELSQVIKGYSRVQFIIKDNGLGMSEEYQKVIFDSFSREQTAHTQEIQGTGLGMAITKSLVDLMGGSIKVESKLNEGSTFTVELELRIPEQKDDTQFWRDSKLTRMIVADDDEEVCQNVVKAMAKTGVVVDYATSGHKAIEMMRTTREAGKPYDMILLDWKMPDLDGLSTARLIRERYPDKIPILLLTAYDWRDIEDEATEVGVEHFMPKPFFMYSFKKAITRLLGENPSTEESSAPQGEANKKDMDSVVRGRHVLVVDDVEVNRMILVKIMTGLGATCDTAVNGEDAMNKFVQSEPGAFDLILMDIQMPVMNGHEATRSIRASGHPDASSVAIIAMTANAFVDDVRDALAAGMDAHVSKPIVLDQLKGAIQEVMDRKGKL